MNQSDQTFHAMPYWQKVLKAQEFGFEMMAGNFIKKATLTPEIIRRVKARIIAKLSENGEITVPEIDKILAELGA